MSKIIISGQQGRVRIPDQDVPYIAAHTHPSGLIFSPSDIRRFCPTGEYADADGSGQ